MSLPTTITGVQLTKGQTPTIASIPLPAVDGSKALVKVTAAPINPSDVMWLQGAYPAGKSDTAFAGLEGVGVVVAAGPGAVPAAKVGQRVAFFVGGNEQGTWANYAVIESSGLIPLPDSIDDDQGACALVNPLTVELFLLECEKKGHSVIVHGAASSSLGLMLIAAAKKAGDKVKIINLVRRAENVALVKSKGAEYVIDILTPNWEAEFAALAKELKPSAYFDPIGGSFGSKVFNLMPDHSTTYNYGGFGDSLNYSISIPDILFKGKVLRGMWLAVEIRDPSVAPVIIGNTLKNLAAKTYQTTIYKKYPVSKFKEALEDYAANAVKGKVLLVPDN